MDTARFSRGKRNFGSLRAGNGEAMYLHLGQETVIKTQDIVGIFDLETSTISKTTRDCLSRAQKAGHVVNVTMEMPKSFVLCSSGKKRETVYVTQISSTTLLKRTGFLSDLSNL